MKQRILIASLVLAILPAQAVFSGAPDQLLAKWQMPDAPPMWVSAEAAIDPSTVVNWALLGREVSTLLRQDIESQQKKLQGEGVSDTDISSDLLVHSLAAADCGSSAFSSEEDGEIGSLPALIHRSRSIFSGVIEEVSSGFVTGLPATLLTVRVSNVVAGSREIEGTSVYVEFPVAYFAIGPYRFCHGEGEFRPASGDQILVFDTQGPIDREGLLFAPIRSQLLLESSTGLVLTDKLRKSPELSSKRNLREVIASVRARISQNSMQ